MHGQCNACQYWEQAGGKCHVFPPQVVSILSVTNGAITGSSAITQWPLTKPTSWCGQFKKR